MIEIRRIRPEEYGEVGALVRHAYEGDYTLEDDYLSEIEDVAGRETDSEVLVAVDRETGALLGTITIPVVGEVLMDDTLPGEFDVRLLGVSPAARGRGIGEAIMRYSFEVARDRGLNRVVLHTGEQMLAAQRLYERLGFTRILDREFDLPTATGPRRIYAYGLDLEVAPTRD